MVIKRKAKQIQIVEKPKYVIISEEEFLKQFETALGVLLVLEKKLYGIKKIVEDRKKKKNAETEYNFVNDNEGPLLKPLYIRQFLAKFDYLEKKNNEKYNHWLCRINEKWILSQNFPMKNLSKDHLRKEFEPKDSAFVRHINLCLKTLEELSDFLKTSVDDDEIAGYLEIKEELILKVQQLFTKFTNEILFRTEHFMDIQDACTSKYDYSSELFQFGFWILRNVPININNEFQPSNEVYYNSLNVKFSIPLSSLFHNLVLLGIHWEDDLFSENGNTFKAPPCTKIDNLGYVLILEHTEKLKLMDAKKKECIKKREEYIDWLIKTKQYPVEEDPKTVKKTALEIKKEKELEKLKNKKGKPKSLRPKPEIITIPPEIKKHDLLDVEQEFYEKEEAKFLDYLNQTDPKFYKMETFEVNQRQYILLGGVYQFEFVKKPDQTVYGNYLVASYIEKQEEDANIGLKSHSENNSMPQSEVFKITFKVPSHLCQWSAPVVCKWYPGKIEDKKNRDDFIIYKEDIIKDFVLNSLLEASQLENIKKHLIPRMTSASSLPDRLLIETDEHYNLINDAEKLMKYLEKRKSPEYLFTTYEAVPAAKVVSNVKEIRVNEKKKFSDILKELESKKNERKSFLKKFDQTPVSKEKDTSKMKVPISHKNILSQAEKDHKATTANTKGSDTVIGMMDSSGEKKLKKFRKKRPKEIQVEEQIVQEINNDEVLTNFPKWSTRHIVKSDFDSENNEVTIWTKKLGLYGFAFPRYIHFPFYNWSMIPHHEDCTRIIFTLMSQYVLFEIEITENGYIPKVIDNKIVFKTVTYLQTEEPIENIVLLKKKLQNYNFNIFPEMDTLIYVSEALEKHYATEYHTYDCMGLSCTFMKFCKSEWNKSSPRSILVMKCGDLREDITALDDVKITPNEAQFVEITSLSTTNVTSTNILLDYKPTWKNIRLSADLWMLIKTTYGSQIPRDLKKPKLCYNVLKFLKAVRPLSFSV